MSDTENHGGWQELARERDEALALVDVWRAAADELRARAERAEAEEKDLERELREVRAQRDALAAACRDAVAEVNRLRDEGLQLDPWEFPIRAMESAFVQAKGDK